MSWPAIYDLVMHEYGIGLREMETWWTPGKTLLYLRKIGERYKKQKRGRKGKPEAKVMTEAELLASDYLKG